MYRAGRTAWGLVAIGAATAVGITTHNPGFIVITFVGTLVLPRVLGLTPRRWNRRGLRAERFWRTRQGLGWWRAQARAIRLRTPRRPHRRRNRSDDRQGGGRSPPRAGPTMAVAMTRVLIVDDEPAIVRLVRDYLERAGFDVSTAANGEEALQLFTRERPDLVILDLTLPLMDGLDVARAMRRAGDVPIIMLTARTEEADRVAGLELGADDYVTKPFSAREIVARVRAVLRRAQTAAMRDDVVRVGDSIVLDVPRMQVQVDGRDVVLTATEFQLLLHMARQPGRVFTRAQLLDAVHGVAVESYERAIDAHVKNIRRKIETDPRSPRHLQTVFGVGYRLVDGDGVSSGPPWRRGEGRRPPWWPEGEAGPWSGGPNWRRQGRRIARRIGCFVGARPAGVAQRHLRRRLVAAQRLWRGQLGSVRHGGGGHRTRARWHRGRWLRSWCSAVSPRPSARSSTALTASRRATSRRASPYADRPDLRSLARAMNAMSGRLEAEETRRRSVLADIAHELRTPLSIIRGQAEAITDGIYPADAEHMAPIVSATESLEMLVNDLGTLTLAESGTLRLHREPVDVAVFVNETLERLRRRGEGCRRAADRARRRRTSRRSTPTREGCAEFWAISSATRWPTRAPAAPSASRESHRRLGAADRPRRWNGHSRGSAPAHLRSLCEGTLVDRFGTRTRDRSRCGRGARRVGDRHQHAGGGHGDHAHGSRRLAPV